MKKTVSNTKRFAEHERKKFIDIIKEKRKKAAVEKETKKIEENKKAEKESQEK